VALNRAAFTGVGWNGFKGDASYSVFHATPGAVLDYKHFNCADAPDNT
jgi:hypothetical protein